MPEKYAKYVLTDHPYAVAAEYEPHPFRGSAISDVIGRKVNTGIPDDVWSWNYYDWCGNIVACGDETPIGRKVDEFCDDDFQYAPGLAEYLNKPPGWAIPKHPIERMMWADDVVEIGLCPICNEGCNSEMDYCSYCGQALDWSDAT